MLVPPDGYVEEVARICRKNGVLFIVDEVICGFGRTGRRFGYQHYGVKPDIVTMAMGITSAYLPLATAVKREIFEAFKGTEEYDHFRHVNTFGGNPAACALAVKNLEIMEEEDLSGRSAKMGERLRGKLAGPRRPSERRGDQAQGPPLRNRARRRQRDPDPGHGREVAKVISGCAREGSIVGKNGDTVAVLQQRHHPRPPLVVSDDDLEFISGALSESLRSL